MAHDVFITHSSKDRKTADAVYSALEQAGIRCWYAPENIRGGASWTASIMDGIANSRVMILVWSKNSNESRHVTREIQLAFKRDVIVIPFRIDDVAPTRELEYYLESVHWLDAITPPLEDNLTRLVEHVQTFLSAGRPSPEVQDQNESHENGEAIARAAEEAERIAGQQRVEEEQQRVEAERGRAAEEERLRQAAEARQRAAAEVVRKRTAEEDYANSEAEVALNITRHDDAEGEPRLPENRSALSFLARGLTKISAAWNRSSWARLLLALGSLVVLVIIVFVIRYSRTAGQWETIQTINTAGSVTGVSFSPDGKTIAVACDWIQLLDLQTGTLRSISQTPTFNLFSLAFSPDGKTIAGVEGYGSVLSLWEIPTGAKKHTFQDGAGKAHAIAFSPNGKMIVSGGGDNYLRLWDVQSGKLTQTLAGHTDAVLFVAFSPDGQTIASAGSDHTLRLWDVQSRTLKRTLEGHNNWVFSVAFSPDGKTIASGSSDKTFKTWDVASGTLKRTLSIDGTAIVAYSPDGKAIAAGLNNSIVVWDSESMEVKATLEGHDYLVRAIAFSPDGTKLASGSLDKTVRLWNVSGAR